MEERIREESAEAEAESDRLRRASDDVLMRIGRNLLVYQRIETNLKQLAAARQPLTLEPKMKRDPLEQIAGHRARIERDTLGRALPKAFIDTGKPDTEDDNAAPLRVILSSRITFDDTPEFREWLKEWQTAVVDARNQLAHGFLDTFDIDNIAGCEQACRKLDDAEEIALRFLHWLRSCIERQAETWVIANDFLRSDAFLTELSSRRTLDALASALGTAAQRLGRPDGWCVYDQADQAIRATEGDLVAEVLDCGHFRTLQEAARTTGAFAWHEEKTSKGRRWLFRWQPSE